MSDSKKQTPKLTPEQIYHAWDQAVANNDMEALLSLYADDAILESPLIPYLMKIYPKRMKIRN